MRFSCDIRQAETEMAGGEVYDEAQVRAALAMSEPEAGSDVQAIRTKALRDGDEYVVNGQKMWVTNGLLSGLVFVLMKSDPKADPPYKGMTCFITEKEPGAERNDGLTIPPKIKKMGYKGVESTELVYDGFRCPPDRILGGEENGLGKGFGQMMDALEVGRVNVAARGVGIAQRALELALRYSQERKTFGREIAQHQAIQFKLADMATKIEAARLLTMKAARLKDAGQRSGSARYLTVNAPGSMKKGFPTNASPLCAFDGASLRGSQSERPNAPSQRPTSE
jgi:alkylation response protein AidB-like acyl-CoA dehydrogenase